MIKVTKLDKLFRKFGYYFLVKIQGYQVTEIGIRKVSDKLP